MAGGFGFIAAAGSLRSWCFADPATWCEPARPLRNRWLRTAPAIFAMPRRQTGARPCPD